MPASLHALSLIFIVAYKVIGTDMFILLIQKNLMLREGKSLA